MSGERPLMEKIVLVSREPQNHAVMIALIGIVFPECTVEFISETEGDADLSAPCLKRDFTSCEKKSSLEQG